MTCLVAIGLLTAAASTGSWILRVARAEAERPIDTLLAAVAIGNGAVGALGLLLAACHGLVASAAWLVVVVAAAPGVSRLVKTVQGAWGERYAGSFTERAALGVSCLYGLALLPAVIAPSVTGDQTKYQLAYPRLYAESGGLVATPWTFWGQQQFLENFVFALGFTVCAEATVHLLHAPIGLVAIAGVGRLGGGWLAPGWGWVGVALLATQPMTWSMFGANGSDLPLVASTVLAVAALVAAERGDPCALRRAGLLAGVAAGSKVMGILTLGLVGLGALVIAGRGGGRSALRAGVIVAACATPLMIGPYVRNAAEVGNPIHPFAQSVFHGAHWSDEASAYLDEYYRQYRADRAKRRDGVPYQGIDVLRFPWDLTLYPESFERSARSALDVGPFMLGALPAAVWLAAVTPAGRIVVVIGAAYLTIIAAGAWAHPRYVLPGLVLLGAAGLGGLVRLFDRRLVAFVAATTVLGQMVVTARLAERTWVDDVAVAVGRLAPSAYLTRHSDRYRFWHGVGTTVPADTTILVLGKIPHPYFIEQPYVLGSYLEQGLIDYRAMDEPVELVALAHRLGVGAIVFETDDLARRADPYEAQVTDLWRRLRTMLGAPILREGSRELYAVPAEVGE